MMIIRHKILFSGFLFIGLLLTSLALSNAAHAQLTEDSIKKFIQITTDISSGHVESMEPEDIKEYLKKHLHKNARFKSNIKYNIPGFPAQETSLSLNKDEYIQGIEKGSEALTEYENNITIEKIKISKDKTRATIRTTGIESGSLPMSVDSVTTEFLPIEGSSSCNQIIKLEDDIIQMYSAICSTVMNFQPFSN